MGPTESALSNVRIVSLAEQMPGPYATLLLADLGADVVTVERPGGDPLRAAPWFFDSLNRGKRSVVLDLKSEADRQHLHRLLSSADALLEGFRPGTVDRLGLAPAAVRSEHPHLVYVSISGFGQDGPLAQRAAHDVSYQGISGVLEALGLDRPGMRPARLPLADIAGAMFAAQAVLVGLLGRQRTGAGCYIDVSMTDALVSWMTPLIVPLLNKTGPAGMPYDPAYGVFTTRDDRGLTISIALEQPFWDALCGCTDLLDAVGVDAWTRREQRDELQGRLRDAIRSRTYADWEQIFTDADIPFAIVNRGADVGSDPQLRARGMFVTVEDEDGEQRVHIPQPLVIDGSRPGPTTRAPRLGEHTPDW